MTLVAGAPHVARAQDAALLQREDDDEERLRRWMAVRASRSPNEDWAAWVAIPTGALAIGFGVGLGATQDERAVPPDLMTPLTTALIALGAFAIGLGVSAALTPNLPHDEQRELPERRLTEREIGRLEGLLRHEARAAARDRTIFLAMGASLAVGGLGAMPIVAAFPPAEAFGLTMSWGIAAGSAALGLLWFVTSLFESSSEADWREYERGLMPRDTPRVSLRPNLDGFLVVF